MADTNTTVWTDFVETALDCAAGMYLTDMPQFRSFVDKRPVDQRHPGDVVSFRIHNRLAPATADLTEGVDVAPVAMPAPRTLNVTLREKGNVVQYTNKLTKLAFTGKVASDIGGAIGENLGLSLDDIYRALMDTATNVAWVDNTGAVVAADPVTEGNISAKGVASAVALLRGRRSPAKDGTFYTALIHPDVAHDLRLESGNTAWQNPKQYVDTGDIYRGEIGAFHGARFIENARCTVAIGTPDVYTTYFLGREALVEAVAEEPHIVVGPQTDNLKRNQSVGWYGILGSAIYRQNSIQLLKTASSLEAISSAATFNPSA